jgi:protein arginine kinase
MNLDDLLGEPYLWACGAEEPDGIAVSSRIRLARNVKGRAFPDWSGEAERLKVWRMMEPELRGLASLRESVSVANEDMTDVERRILVERHLASREHAAKGRGSGIVIRGDERAVVMVNEEDHLRLQTLCCGLRLHEAWAAMDALERELDARVEFAFHPQLGYLTACPTNVGTGLRASVMLHLPALVLMEEMGQVVNGIQKIGLAVRGLWGEGTEAVGHMFQISNQMTMGQAEEEIVGDLDRIVQEIIVHERNARARLMRHREALVRDHIGRAIGILTHAHILSSVETLSHLSALRLGLDLGIVRRWKRVVIDELLLVTQLGHIQRMAGGPLSPRDRDEVRARLVRERLGTRPRGRGGRKTTT